jgi:predicted ester cyclase
MELPRFWDSRMNWYGPAGIGTGRGINGFRHWHQIPFLNAMPDRGQHSDEIIFHFFADNQYCAVTGWPNMVQTVSDDGWMGIAPSGKTINLRSLDFWRIDNGRIRENWVLVDILDVYRQLNVDVFARLREFNKARPKGNISYQ